MRMLRRSLFGAAAFILSTAVAFAQATAELNGRVTDESGAVLPGVTVTATQTDTGFTRSVVTDGNGTYVMPNLPTGPYRLEVMLQGFRTYVQTGIVLQVAATPTINAALAVGSLEETVSVEAAAPLVDVRSAGISEVVEQERILELPLQGRNVTDLIVLAGAAVQSRCVSASGSWRAGCAFPFTPTWRPNDRAGAMFSVRSRLRSIGATMHVSCRGDPRKRSASSCSPLSRQPWRGSSRMSG